MNQKPLVSVLMTVFNREKYISDAIESVLASTYTNFELIIVDDLSTDKSLEIAKSFEERDNRITIFVNEKNLGDYHNRNKAASLAKGKYLKYVDADDKVYPYGLEQLIFYMEQFPEAGYGLCSLKQDKSEIYPFVLNPEKAYIRNYFKDPIFNKAPLSAIIKTESFNKHGPFTGKRLVGDYEMWHILSKHVSVVLMPHGIVWYREHDDQESQLTRVDPLMQFAYFDVALEMLRAEDCPLNKNDKEQALKSVHRHIATSIISAGKHHSIQKAVELSKRGKMSIPKALYTKLF